MKASIDAKKMIYDYFQNLCADAALCSQLSELATIEELPANTCILEEGERPDCICLVLSGIVRGFYISEDGTDITKCFTMEYQWCCSYSLLSTEPSPYYIETLEDCVLAKFNVKHCTPLIDSHPALRKTLDELIRKVILQGDVRTHSFLAMEAKERYLHLVQECPDLVLRVKQEYIASYIGVTPSSLSRLKKSL